MYKLVLSTPRSGSHFYSESIESELVLHEILSRANNNQYLEEVDEFTIHMTNLPKDEEPNSNQYFECLRDNKVNKIYGIRGDKEVFFKSYIDELTKDDRLYIVHEHINLLQPEWLQTLIDNSVSATYLKRKIITEQIASRIIAGFTGVYIIRNNGKMLCHGNINKRHMYNVHKFEFSITNSATVNRLLDVYKTADNLSNGLSNISTVFYEDIRNSSADTKKIFSSTFKRLCEEDQQLILDTIHERF